MDRHDSADDDRVEAEAVAPTIAVVGLWHLGCSVVAGWLKLGFRVRAIDLDPAIVEDLRSGKPPLYEPGLEQIFIDALREQALEVSTDPSRVADCQFVFAAGDTPVDDEDRSNVEPLWRYVKAIGAYLDPASVLIVSAQVPAGTSRRIREHVRSANDRVEVVYVPENLQLGDAIAHYLHPGYLVIGAVSESVGRRVRDLFEPMHADVHLMDLESAEMVKHALNAFLATSVTLANQLSDVCTAVGGDYSAVKRALRADARVGERAYVDAGLGFSGGTLGRDLRALDELNVTKALGQAPLFGQVLDYNRNRILRLVENVSRAAGEGGRVCILGMTYKAGTSTLRRSPAVQLADGLLRKGMRVSVHDPRADLGALGERGAEVADSPYAAARGADLLVLMTEWPEYRALDPRQLAGAVRERRIVDPKAILIDRRAEFEALGFDLRFSTMAGDDTKDTNVDRA